MASDQQQAKHVVQLPRFIVDEPVGAGQVIKRDHQFTRCSAVSAVRATGGAARSMAAALTKGAEGRLMNDDPAVSQQPSATNPGNDRSASTRSRCRRGTVPAVRSGVEGADTVPAVRRVADVAMAAWVYAIGRIVPRFPDLGVEKEFAQAGAGNVGGAVETDRLIAILQQEEFRYLARQLCWILHNGESDALVLACRDDAEAERLVNTMPDAETADHTIQVIVGSTRLGAIDTPCATTGLPAVTIDQHLTFPIDQFISALAEAQHDGKSGRARRHGGRRLPRRGQRPLRTPDAPLRQPRDAGRAPGAELHRPAVSGALSGRRRRASRR